jgi:hypothetical protein
MGGGVTGVKIDLEPGARRMLLRPWQWRAVLLVPLKRWRGRPAWVDASTYVSRDVALQDKSVDLDANTWASIVAHVSALGENAERFNAALTFHTDTAGFLGLARRLLPAALYEKVEAALSPSEPIFHSPSEVIS